MPKPWERYQQPDTGATGPWAKYGGGEDSTAKPDFSRVRGEFRSAPHPQPEADHPLRGVAMGVRNLAEGAAGAVDFFSGPLRYGIEQLTGEQQATYGDLVRRGADYVGLPEARTPLERGVASVSRGLGGTALTMGGGAIASGGQGLAREAGRFLAANPAQQVAGAVSGSTAANLVAEQGGGPIAQTVAGIAGGVAPAAAPRTAAAVASPATQYAARFTEGGARRQAAEQIRDEATSLGNIMRPAPSSIPGVRRTLAEESQDPGVSRLQQHARNQRGGGAFADLAVENNASRVDALRRFGGDEAAIEAAEAARAAATNPLRRQAERSNAVVDTSRLIGGIDRAIASLDGRPLVQQALRDLREQLHRPATAAQRAASPDGPDFVPRDDVRTLYNVRKTIGDWLSTTSDKPYREAAQRELLVARDALDNAMANASPEFAQYLQAFRAASRGVDRLKVGRQLVEGGAGKNITDPLGNPVLTPNSFGGQARNLDKVAKDATGFRKAKAAKILQPGDMATIRAIQDDLNRVGNVTRAGLGQGSATAPLKQIEERLAQDVVGSAPVVGGMASTLSRVGNDRVNEQLIYLLQHPDEARRVLASLQPRDRAALSDVLARLGAPIGAAVSAQPSTPATQNIAP